MTSNTSPKAISPLRARMIEDMTIRGFTPKTQSDYIRSVKRFAAFIDRSPDTATPEELRQFQFALREDGATPSAINAIVSALRFFFKVTLDRPDIDRPVDLMRSDTRSFERPFGFMVLRSTLSWPVLQISPRRRAWARLAPTLWDC